MPRLFALIRAGQRAQTGIVEFQQPQIRPQEGLGHQPAAGGGAGGEARRACGTVERAHRLEEMHMRVLPPGQAPGGAFVPAARRGQPVEGALEPGDLGADIRARRRQPGRRQQHEAEIIEIMRRRADRQIRRQPAGQVAAAGGKAPGHDKIEQALGPGPEIGGQRRADPGLAGERGKGIGLARLHPEPPVEIAPWPAGMVQRLPDGAGRRVPAGAGPERHRLVQQPAPQPPGRGAHRPGPRRNSPRRSAAPRRSSLSRAIG